MSVVRWWGLGAFVVIVAVTVLGWLVFADGLVRRGIEAAGTRMVGARVELDSADVGFSPARLELRGLAVTDPDAPMRNAVAAERIAFDLDWLGLFLDRIHVDEVSVEGMRFDTARSRSGAIEATRAPAETPELVPHQAQRSSLPPLEVPSAAQVLEREQLESPAAIEQARTRVAQRSERLSGRAEALPDRATLSGYRQDLEAIEDARGTKEQLRAAKRLRDLVDAIDDDLKDLRRARREASAALTEAREVAGEARRAPTADIARLYRKYTDPGAVATEVMHYLLDPAVAGWLNSGWYWYQRISPYLGDTEAEEPVAVRPARGAGRVVEFPEAMTEPSLLVRQIRLSGGGEGGRLDGRVTDIAAPASTWGEPLQVRARGEAVAGFRRLALDAAVDRRTPGASTSRIDFEGNGTALSGWSLGAEQGLRAERGQADVRVTGTVVDGALDLDLAATVREARFEAATTAQPVLARAAEAMSDAGRLSLQAEVTGTTADPEIRITSSLEGLLEPVLRESLEKASSGFRESLAEAIRARTAEPLAALDAAQTELRAVEAELTERVERFEETRKRARKKLD